MVFPCRATISSTWRKRNLMFTHDPNIVINLTFVKNDYRYFQGLRFLEVFFEMRIWNRLFVYKNKDAVWPHHRAGVKGVDDWDVRSSIVSSIGFRGDVTVAREEHTNYRWMQCMRTPFWSLLEGLLCSRLLMRAHW